MAATRGGGLSAAGLAGSAAVAAAAQVASAAAVRKPTIDRQIIRVANRQGMYSPLRRSRGSTLKALHPQSPGCAAPAAHPGSIGHATEGRTVKGFKGTTAVASGRDAPSNRPFQS